jgi:hypothetical protein
VSVPSGAATAGAGDDEEQQGERGSGSEASEEWGHDTSSRRVIDERDVWRRVASNARTFNPRAQGSAS